MMQPSELAKLLSSKYENDDEHYMYQLKYKNDEIIKSFGGYHHLLQLYLTSTIDVDATNKLYSLLTAQTHPNMDIDVDIDIVNDINRQNQVNRTQLLKQYSIATLNNLEINTRKHIIPTVHEQRRLFVPEMLKVDVCDNIYFVILGSRENANWFYNRVVKSIYIHIFACLVLFLSAISISISSVIRLTKTSGLIWYIWSHYIAWILVAFATSHIFGLNIELMKATTKTFDFGYKLVQGIVLLITLPLLLLKGEYSVYDVVVFEVLVVVGFTLVLYLDAMSLAMKSKLILLFATIMLLTILPFYIYFFFQDVEWDPFNGSWGEQFTTISFKSALLNALMNSILMFMKGFCVGIMSFMDRKSPNKRFLFEEGYVKSVSMLNRPFIRWFTYRQHAISLQDDKKSVNTCSDIHYDDIATSIDVAEINCTKQMECTKLRTKADDSISSDNAQIAEIVRELSSEL